MKLNNMQNGIERINVLRYAMNNSPQSLHTEARQDMMTVSDDIKLCPQ